MVPCRLCLSGSNKKEREAGTGAWQEAGRPEAGCGEATATRDLIDQSVLLILSHFMHHRLGRCFQVFGQFLGTTLKTLHLTCLLLCIANSDSKFLSNSDVILLDRSPQTLLCHAARRFCVGPGWT